MDDQINISQTTIVQGADKFFNLYVIDPLTRQPIDLSTATEVTLTFRNTDLSLLTLTTVTGGGIVFIATPKVGLAVSLSSAQTSLLQEGCGQTFKLSYTLLSKKTVLLLKNSLSVEYDPLATDNSGS